MKKTQIEFILISCCTCQRPHMLSKSLNSVKNLVLPKNVRIELLVIDNDKKASSKKVIEELKQSFPIKINYFVEEERGIANARNRLLKESLSLGASHIALFDDDEILDENWLISHYYYYNHHPEALIISGPTYNMFENPVPDYVAKNNIFKSSTTKKTGLIRNICASGNVFFATTIMSEAGIYFNTDFVFMGGEDGEFFSKASKAGFEIVWNNEAINRELIGDERANIKWILNRNYYNGYSSAYLRFKKKTPLIKRLFFIAKTSVVLLLDCLIMPFSALLGLTAFFNALGITYKTKGKMDAAIKNKPLNYYQNICGH
ncbi:MAG: glycosyltransferase family A protein [bacterium]